MDFFRIINTTLSLEYLSLKLKHVFHVCVVFKHIESPLFSLERNSYPDQPAPLYPARRFCCCYISPAAEDTTNSTETGSEALPSSNHLMAPLCWGHQACIYAWFVFTWNIPNMTPKISMPSANGFTTCQQSNVEEATKQVPKESAFQRPPPPPDIPFGSTRKEGEEQSFPILLHLGRGWRYLAITLSI